MLVDLFFLFAYEVVDGLAEAAHRLDGVAAVHHLEELVLAQGLLLDLKLLLFFHELLHLLEVLFDLVVAIRRQASGVTTLIYELAWVQLRSILLRTRLSHFMREAQRV